MAVWLRQMTLRFVLNGEPVELTSAPPHVTLLQWLRSSGYTGSKEGCAEGECGACAVAWLRNGSDGRARYEAVNSCLIPLPAVHGQHVVTVEGVAEPDGTLHPVQQAMVERGGSQCGYCTPGFVISLFCEYYRPGRDGYDPEAISGNLCRCTGYRPIVDVAQALAQPAPNDRRLKLLADPAPQISALQHGAHGSRFLRPSTLSEAFELFAAHPEAVWLNGGTDLMVYENQRYQRFPTFISLEALQELNALRVEPTEIELGAGLPLAQLEERLHAAAGELAALEQLLPLFSSRLIRHRATLGGSLATASPIGDAAPVLLALDATLVLASAAGERRVPLHEFFTGYRSSALLPGELIRSVRLPRPVAALQRFYKVSKRVLDDISTVAAAFALDLAPDGRVQRLCIAFGGVAATPLRALAVEQAANGEPWEPALLERLLPVLDTIAAPRDDFRGRASYRRAMMSGLLQKFMTETSGQVQAAE